MACVVILHEYGLQAMLICNEPGHLQETDQSGSDQLVILHLTEKREFLGRMAVVAEAAYGKPPLGTCCMSGSGLGSAMGLTWPFPQEGQSGGGRPPDRYYSCAMFYEDAGVAFLRHLVL